MTPPTFPLSVWYPVKFGERGFKTAISRGYGGAEKRDSIVSVSIRSFSFPCRKLTLAQISTIWNFFESGLGAFTSFYLNIMLENGTWTNVLVRFDDDAFNYSWTDPLWHEIGTIILVTVPS